MNNSMIAWTALGVLSGLAAAGCSMETGQAPGDEVATESVGEVNSALRAVACDPNTYDGCWEQTDSTGLISTRLYLCKTTSSAEQHQVAACPVESDRALVGGGAQIVDGGPNGAMLGMSFPSDQSWIAFSKDHIYPSRHTMRAYAIGLRLAKYSVDQLREQIHITPGNSPNTAQSHPTAQASIPSGDVLLGGGALAASSGAEGQLLTASYPVSGGWVAMSKDHIKPDRGWVTAFAISIPRCPPAFTDANGGQVCLKSTIAGKSAASASGYFGLSLVDGAANSLVTGVGAQTTYNSAGRMLVSLYPYPTSSGAAYMVSKDHGYVDTGNDWVGYVALARE